MKNGERAKLEELHKAAEKLGARLLQSYHKAEPDTERADKIKAAVKKAVKRAERRYKASIEP